MSKQRHIIGRTVLELDTNQLADVWSLQEDVSRLFQQQGLEEMAHLFDQLVTQEEVVRLDRLEVDIGSIDRRFLSDEFIQNLLVALRETLGDRLTERLLNNNAAKPETITRDGSDWQVLLHFLRYGRLPWWCPTRDWQEWLSRWLAVIRTDTNWRHYLRELLINHPAAQQRLVEQLPEEFRHQLILHLQPTWINWHTLLIQAKQLIQSLELDKGAGRYLEQQAWLLLFREIGAENAPTRPFPITWIRNWLTQLVQIWGHSAGFREQAGEQKAGSMENSIFPSASYQIVRQRLRAILASVPNGEQSLWFTALDEALNSITDITQQNPESIFTTPSEQSQEQDEEKVHTPQTDGEILLYFLQYGRFPGEQPSADWQEWLSRWLVVVQSDTAWQLPLRQLLRNHPEVRQRLVSQLPEALRHQVILQLQPDWTIWGILLAQARLLMQCLSLSSDSFQELERQAWELLFAEIDTDNATESPLPAATWIRNWLTLLMQNWRWSAEHEEQGARGQSYQIPRERLRTIIDAVSPAQRTLWLNAYNQVLNITAKETTTASLQHPEDHPRTDWEILLYFLQYGRFPGEQSSANWQDWLSRWSSAVQSDTSWQLSLRQLLRVNPEAGQRLVTEFPEDFRHQLLLQLQPSWGKWRNLLTQATKLIQGLSLSNNICEQLLQKAWMLLLAEIPQDNASERPLPEVIWIRNWLIQLLESWVETLGNHTINQAEYQHLRTIIAALPIAETSPWLTALDQVLTTTSTNTIAPSANWQESPILQADNNSILSTEEETAGLYITQAGLVLLHPFIRFYFEAVGLLNNELFRDESAQQTAIYLLYYLATKQTDVPEYELVLPKLLCGCSLNQPVARGLDLPEAALEEGERLLQTVINYWEVLKNTSPDGLREGFLQRQGKLTRTGDGNWKLQVEQQAIDVLLGSLPWGLSMVKLPWMDELLIVEWS